MAQTDNKVIITCAVTGSIHTPTMSPHLPVTPDQIARDAVAAAQAGAAIIHLHARDPETGRPSPDPDLFMRFLPRIKQQCDAVVNITTGGGQGMTLEQRIAAARRASPEMASLNMGSINFGLYPMLNRYQTFNHAWERKHLEDSRDAVFKNTFSDIERVLEELGEGCGTRFEFECYDVGHLYTLAHFLDRGLVRPPLFVQTVFGILGGIGPDPEHVMHTRRIADQRFGAAHLRPLLAPGRHQMPLCTMAATMGANVRVGLEDSLYLGKGELAPDNASQVAKIRRILEELSLPPGTLHAAQELTMHRAAAADAAVICKARVAQGSKRQGWQFVVVEVTIADDGRTTILDGRTTLPVPPRPHCAMTTTRC